MPSPFDARNRPKSNDLRPLSRLLPYLGRYRLQVFFAIAALIVAAVTTLVIPVAVRRIVDHGFTASNADLLNQYFGAMLLAVAVLAVSSAMRFYYVMWLGERVVADIRDALFRHLMTLTPGFYENQQTGEVVSRLTADTGQIKSAFSSTASIALRNSITLIGAIVMMIATSPLLTGLAALAIPAIVIPLVTYGRRVRKLSRKAQDALAESAAFAQERLAAIATVQANTQEVPVNAHFSAATKVAFDAARKRSQARAILTFLVILVSTGAIVGLLWHGAQLVISERMTAGVLSQFALYAVFGASSLGQLSEVWGEIQLAAGAAERISELLDEKPSIQAPAKPVQMPQRMNGEIEFRNVSFSYPARPETKVLQDIGFKVAQGETVALVGPSGAGKSTIFNLLERFNDPASGSIEIDGINIASMDIEALRTNIAMVPQDPVIFSGTIAENIRFARPDASEADVLSAARDARVDEFAERMPDRYETRLGERGVTLSGGQRQRVALARTILRNAPILLLDEATSALDAESEALIQEALERITKDRTTLVIAHRLATVRNADRILVIDDGRIVGSGAHGQLINASPLYAKLAKLQFTAPSA
jgi:ATP-binding cassette, subfamily B, bacterial